MKWQFKKLLLKVAIITLALTIAAVTIQKAYFKNEQNVNSVKIIELDKQISNSEFIISEEMILGKLQSKSEIVSVEQEINKTDTKVDDGFLGKRETEMNVHGSYKMGISTKNIHIANVDNENGTVYISLGNPELVSLEIPFNEVEIEKTSGWLRLSMSEDETKSFYKSVHKNIENEILNDKEIMSQANLNNQRVIKELLIGLPGVNDIIFSEESVK
ncbi:DUF4230 domain-containing protein [Metabacillus arenae]|uniref:DUF4230 domain-containing protein n=1 Tax=Metabacillus arenae TaxID=2771434 RepID=A0A926RWE8_9BACI|nr:DUF4230 domain-containing protein [Metabacillus arenae]MBD1379097.1 DUF4230 domain-containing protein [Metabacillus arenae]